MPRAGKQQERVDPQPRLRRAYYECRYGQLHLHNAIPPGGGFDELTPVIALHADGETGAVFLPAMRELGVQRSVYALDLPGIGGSDPAPGTPAADAAFNVVCDFLDNMRLRQVDVIARGASAVAALRLLEQRAGNVRRTVLVEATVPARAGTALTTLGNADATPQRLQRLLAPGA